MVVLNTKVDWLTITGKGSIKEVQGEQLNSITAEAYAKDRLSYLLQDFQLLEQQRGEGFYQYVFKDRVTGVTLALSDDLERQGWRFVMSGGCAIADVERQHILQRAVDGNLNVTRLDIAVDVMQSGITPERVDQLYRNERHSGRKLSHDFKKRIKGDTFYLGSRDSAYYLRVYDKSKEQALSDDWIRVELEMKDYAAQGYKEICAYDPVQAVREMRRMLDLPGSKLDVLLSSLMDGVERERPKAPYTAGNVEVWFRETVSAAFRNLCKEDYEAATRVLEGLQGYHLEGFVAHMQFLDEIEAKKGKR